MVRYAAQSSRVIRHASPKVNRSVHRSSPRAIKLQLPFFSVVLGMFFCLSLLALAGFFMLSQRSWDGKTPQNILIVPSSPDGSIDHLYVLQLRPNEQAATVITLPAELPVTILSGYGEYPLRSIYPLLKIEQKSPEFVRAVLSHALQLPLTQIWSSGDRRVLEQLGSDRDSAQERGKLALVRSLWASLRGQLAVPLSIPDRLQAWWWALQRRPDQVRFRTSQAVANWSADRTSLKMDIPASACAVTVVNSTTVPKVGGAIATSLEGTGFTVLRVTDDVTTQSSSSILVDETAKHECAGYLPLLQGLLPETVLPSVKEDIYQRYRAHIVMIVGNDLANEFAKSRKN